MSFGSYLIGMKSFMTISNFGYIDAVTLGNGTGMAFVDSMMT